VWQVVFIVIGYLIGSIPSAYLIGKSHGVDIRKVGDGNVGAANAFQKMGPAAGMTVLLADVIKGIVPMLLVQAFADNIYIIFLTGIATLLGHILPVYIGFRGGRGESTAAGILVVLLPVPVLILFGIAIIPVLITRNTMLLGAIMFVPLSLLALLFGAQLPLIIYSIVIPAIVGIAHFFTTRNLPADVRRQGKYLRKSG
jgi:acyl phosphate:glycerol-3-phosphate acyltransferase